MFLKREGSTLKIELRRVASSQMFEENSKGYAKSPEFSPLLGLIILGKKSVATNLR